jgi:hypothetical protein
MQCEAKTKKGSRCTIEAEPGSAWCHVHHPNLAYRQMHGLAKPSRHASVAISPSLFGHRDWQLA